MSKKIEEMDAAEKAALLESIARIMEANNKVGTYKLLEQIAANRALDILTSIK